MASEIQHPKKRAFLAAFGQVGNLTQAAEIAGINRNTHYDWMQDPEYAEAFEVAKKEAADRLEAEARRRAVEGVEEPVYYQGQVCGTVRRYSDTLLIFLLKGALPDKYKERVANELSAGDDGLTIIIGGKDVTTSKPEQT
ncbi:MAG: hypothetical protein HPY52_11115 [Firmicutes bacterium]|nr:hypothetical protein [Bacillota bacterium]